MARAGPEKTAGSAEFSQKIKIGVISAKDFIYLRLSLINHQNLTLMGLNCGCPGAESLPSITFPECKEALGQLYKVIFQRVYQSQGVPNKQTAAQIKSKTNWTGLKAATDSTKVLVSPDINNPTTEPGDLRTFGGGNQTQGGIEQVIGTDPTTFEGVMYQESQTMVIKPLKALMCENVGVYLIDEYGNIGCLGIETTVEGQTVVEYRPIPIGKLYIGDKKLGGFEEPDSNAIKWSFFPNWSDDFVIIPRAELDFDPLTEL